jgi:hypothetical protein
VARPSRTASCRPSGGARGPPRITQFSFERCLSARPLSTIARKGRCRTSARLALQFGEWLPEPPAPLVTHRRRTAGRSSSFKKSPQKGATQKFPEGDEALTAQPDWRRIEARSRTLLGSSLGELAGELRICGLAPTPLGDDADCGGEVWTPPIKAIEEAAFGHAQQIFFDVICKAALG